MLTARDLHRQTAAESEQNSPVPIESTMLPAGIRDPVHG